MREEPKNTRLLLVDDEDEFRQAAAKALERHGFIVSNAESGERALEMINESVPDVVVLDLRMGGMDGIATLEEIRKVAMDLPVLILTGHGNFQDALAGIQLDIVDFLQKPVDMSDLADRISRLMDKENEFPLREKSIGDLMVDVHRYRKIYSDQTIQEVVAGLTDQVFKPATEDETTLSGRRAMLLFNRQELFLGLVRAEDIVRLVVPPFLRSSPYSSYFTGMFLAQTKILGKQLIGDLVANHFFIESGAPLMEAVNIMVSERLTSLPIMRDGELAGILREDDLFKEISDSILGR